jgi:hypothetical protein
MGWTARRTILKIAVLVHGKFGATRVHTVRSPFYEGDDDDEDE